MTLLLRKISEVSSFEDAFSANILEHLSITDASQASIAKARFAASRQYIERQTGRPFFSQNWELRLSGWPCAASIGLGLTPVVGTPVIKYRDLDNVEQTLPEANYLTFNSEDSASFIWFYTDISLPSLYTRPDAVKVTFVAGNGSDVASVLPPLREAALKLTKQYWDNPTVTNVGNIVNELPHTFQSILNANRIGGFIG